MKKRFILLIDFSEYSNNLIKYACDWSKKAKAELLLVHQTNVLIPAIAGLDTRQQIALNTNAEALQNLKSLSKELIPSSVKVSYSVSDTPLQHTLNKYLSEPFENLIFAGLKGTGLLKKIFIGSVTIQIIDSINNIVVAMPKEIFSFSHRKILVAVTEKYPFNIVEFNKFLNLCTRENTCISFFYMAKPQEKVQIMEKKLHDISELFKDKFTVKTAIYYSRNPFNDIKGLINIKEEEILVVQKGSRILTDQLFRRFLINELVYHGQTPMIVLP